jgi:hypothetical protein
VIRNRKAVNSLIFLDKDDFPGLRRRCVAVLRHRLRIELDRRHGQTRLLACKRVQQKFQVPLFIGITFCVGVSGFVVEIELLVRNGPLSLRILIFGELANKIGDFLSLLLYFIEREPLLEARNWKTKVC